MKLYVVDLYGYGLIEVVHAVKKSGKSYWVETQNPFLGGDGKLILKKNSLETQYDKVFDNLPDAMECLINDRKNKVQLVEKLLAEAQTSLQKAQSFVNKIKEAQCLKTT